MFEWISNLCLGLHKATSLNNNIICIMYTCTYSMYYLETDGWGLQPHDKILHRNAIIVGPINNDVCLWFFSTITANKKLLFKNLLSWIIQFNVRLQDETVPKLLHKYSTCDSFIFVFCHVSLIIQNRH